MMHEPSHPQTLLRQLAVALVVIASPNSLHARVAPLEFSVLVRTSDVIVLGKVVSVDTIKGVKIARVKVLETYKGRKHNFVSFVAQPSWICDTSEAITGETALFFLRSYIEPRNGLARGFFPPPASSHALESEGAVKPVLILMHSGRGRMPLRMIAGERYVTLWIDDVRLPASIQTVAGPKPKSSYIRSVRLTEMIDLIGANMASGANGQSRVSPVDK